MSKKQKRWSRQDKLSILREALQEGVMVTCRKHEVSIGTFYNWNRAFELVVRKSGTPLVLILLSLSDMWH